MATRVKATGLECRAAFDAVLDEVATLSVDLRQLAAERDEAVQAVQERFNGGILELKERLKGLAAQAEKYALAHRGELFADGKKSSETALSVFGFRLGQPTLVLLNRKWTWLTVIETLKALGKTEFITVKEAPDKDAMKARLDDAALAAVGCCVKQDETFWVEPKLEVGS